MLGHHGEINFGCLVNSRDGFILYYVYSKIASSWRNPILTLRNKSQVLLLPLVGNRIYELN